MHTRPQGVQVPQGQLSPDEMGPANTVKHVIPMIPCAVQYFDEHGKAHNTIVYKIGSAIYFDMNAERWASGLRGAADYIVEAVEKELSAHAASVPDEDKVDVMDIPEGVDVAEGAKEAAGGDTTSSQ